MILLKKLESEFSFHFCFVCLFVKTWSINDMEKICDSAKPKDTISLLLLLHINDSHLFGVEFPR